MRHQGIAKSVKDIIADAATFMSSAGRLTYDYMKVTKLRGTLIFSVCGTHSVICRPRELLVVDLEEKCGSPSNKV